MRFNKKILLLTFSFFLQVQVFAQSPITNTPFYTAYLDFSIVSKAEMKGYLDKEIADFLLSDQISTDLKAAIINALSFEILGKDNTERFIRFLLEKYKSADFVQLADKLTADELFCLGYFKVMDDYFSPEYGLPYLEKALLKNPESFTINMIHALTSAQAIFNYDKCKAWKLVKDVKNNPKLTQRMLMNAENIIYDYFKDHEAECPK